MKVDSRPGVSANAARSSCIIHPRTLVRRLCAGVGLSCLLLFNHAAAEAPPAVAARVDSAVPPALVGILPPSETAKRPMLSFSLLQLTDLHGASLGAANLTNKRVVVYFWSIYCATCVPTVRELQALRSELSREGVELVTVHLFEADRDRIEKKLKDLNVDLPVYLGNVAVRDQFQIRLLPTSLLFDADHYLVGRIDGMAGAKDLEGLLASESTASSH